MGQAGEKGRSQSRSKIYRQNQHYPHETLLWWCGNSKYGCVCSLCFWGIAQIFLRSRIEQLEGCLGLNFLYLCAPGFVTCPSSCWHFLVASGLVNIVNVHLVTCRSPALASVVNGCCRSHIRASVFCAVNLSRHHLNQSVVFWKIAQLLSWLEKD